MKFLLILVAGIMTCYRCIAQQDSSYFLIEDAIRSRKGFEQIVYLDSSILFYQPFHLFLRKGRIIGYKGKEKVGMKFTGGEIKYLDKEFKRKSSIKWNGSLFTNSIRISQDTLLLLERDTASRAYFKRHFANKYFYFSQPIFIRNRTIAIFRIAEMEEPSAGYDLLYIYTKRQGKWDQQMLIHAGAW